MLREAALQRPPWRYTEKHRTVFLKLAISRGALYNKDTANHLEEKDGLSQAVNECKGQR